MKIIYEISHENIQIPFLFQQPKFASIMVHPSMTNRKTTALSIWAFVCKEMSLLLNMLPRFVLREGNGTPLQYSCLENPMDGGAWWAAVHGVAKSQTRLSDFTFTFHFMHWRRNWQLQCSCLENPMDGGA